MLICYWILDYFLSHCIFIYLSFKALLITLGFDLFSGTFAQPLWMCVKVRGTRTERLKTLTTGWVGGMPVIMWMMDICMCTLSLVERNGGLVYVAHILTAFHTHTHTHSPVSWTWHYHWAQHRNIKSSARPHKSVCWYYTPKVSPAFNTLTCL